MNKRTSTIRLRIIYLIITFTLPFFVFKCQVQKEIDKEPKTSIGIINPTVGSLEGVAELIKFGALKVDDLQFVAVCYNKAERDFSKVKEYIKNRKDNLFKYLPIEGELDPEELFRKNSLSDQFEIIFEETDGLFFLGGADFPPITYNEKTNLLTAIYTPHRHYFELSFLFHLLGGNQDSTFIPLLSRNQNYVVVGFCLGMQSLNAATGGSMFQDIPSELYDKKYVEDVLSQDEDQQHKNYWQNLHPDEMMIWANFHRIKPVASHHFFNDQLWQYNPTPHVYSSHHQAVKDTGLNIEIIATSMDGKIPEIIVHKEYKNAFGVQFHPEKSPLYNKNGERLKWFPEDSLQNTYYSYLEEKNSLRFHFKFWEKIGDLFKY